MLCNIIIAITVLKLIEFSDLFCFLCPNFFFFFCRISTFCDSVAQKMRSRNSWLKNIGTVIELSTELVLELIFMLSSRYMVI